MSVNTKGKQHSGQPGKRKKNEPPRQTRREKLAALLTEMESRLSNADTKISVSDFMRLVQFERELAEQERPREIKVTWSEPLEMSDIDE